MPRCFDFKAKGVEFEDERTNIALSAYTGDALARKRLDTLNREIALHGAELESLRIAVAAAEVGVERAKQAEQRAKDAENAEAIKKKFAHLVKLAEAADEHLQAFRLLSSEIRSEVSQLHGLGQPMPTDMQVLTFCSLATSTVMMQLLWAREMEARHLAPHERRSFSKLFNDWHDVAVNHLKETAA